MKYDYIIVGAGIGGLSAGLNLAFNNKKVLVLEKNSLPGGLVTTFKRGRFEFDASLYDLMDYGNDKHIGSLQRLFKKYDLEIETLPIPYNVRIKSIDDKFDEVIKGEIDDWVLRLEELHSGSMSTFRSLLPILKEVHEALVALKKGRKNWEKDFPNFIKYLDKNAYEALVDLNLPNDTIHILGYIWIEIGSPLNKLNFIDFAEYMYKYIFKRPVALQNKNIDLTLKLANNISEKLPQLGQPNIFKLPNDVPNEIRIQTPRILFSNSKELNATISVLNASLNMIGENTSTELQNLIGCLYDALVSQNIQIQSIGIVIDFICFDVNFDIIKNKYYKDELVDSELVNSSWYNKNENLNIWKFLNVQEENNKKILNIKCDINNRGNEEILNKDNINAIIDRAKEISENFKETIKGELEE